MSALRAKVAALTLIIYALARECLMATVSLLVAEKVIFAFLPDYTHIHTYQWTILFRTSRINNANLDGRTSAAKWAGRLRFQPDTPGAPYSSDRPRALPARRTVIYNGQSTTF